ncbi:biliverdin-producing heme oxygenase [Rothia uropygialis]|uniref:biliverdin-producing heme oxygenase n=1 Tax=Kocuria sp. 36 TaxID=1415402 RepID=UPI001EE8CFEE|nr:biliverdin-producing heme oxygenase [Kocuria sp. 36]
MKSAPHIPPNADDASSEDTRFSAIVRTRTAERHSKAEHSTFMSDLMEGSLDAAAYTQLLTQYEYIYEALESVAHRFRQLDDDLTRPFNQPGLDRLASIRHDLRQLRKPGDSTLPCLTSTSDYVERIRQTAGSPERFLAHHYLRYLGDLSGGQAVAALMGRHYGVPREGLSMYRFEDLPKPKIFKDQYRTLLDEAPMSEEQRQAFLDEAVLGFDLNARVFDDLAAHRERAGTTI